MDIGLLLSLCSFGISPNQLDGLVWIDEMDDSTINNLREVIKYLYRIQRLINFKQKTPLSSFFVNILDNTVPSKFKINLQRSGKSLQEITSNYS